MKFLINDIEYFKASLISSLLNFKFSSTFVESSTRFARVVVERSGLVPVVLAQLRLLSRRPVDSDSKQLTDGKVKHILARVHELKHRRGHRLLPPGEDASGPLQMASAGH